MLIIGAIVLGGLAFINAWDIVTSLALVSMGYALGIASRRGLTAKTVWVTLGTMVFLGVLSYLFYLPLYSHLTSPLNGIRPNLFYPTRMSHYLVMFGILLAPCIIWIALLYKRHRIAASPALLLWSFALVVTLCIVVVAGLVVYLRSDSFLALGAQITPTAYEFISRFSLIQTIFFAALLRAANPWSIFGLAALLVLGLVAMKHLVRAEQKNNHGSAADLFIILVMTFAFFLCLTVEMVYVSDYFGSRMNTVFKLYYQAWILFAISAAYSLSQIFKPDKPIFIRVVTVVLVAPLLAGGMFYPLAAVPDRAGHFQTQPTLDAMAYLRSNSEDVAAIEWIRHNIPPTAIILEADGASFSPDIDNRISIFTANPTLLGWALHELQWRGKGIAPILQARKEVIEQIYQCEDGTHLLNLLHQWKVDYVVMGGIEREKYHMTLANGACLQDHLLTVFEMGGLRIWKTP